MLKLSDLLRYSLYETREGRVTLDHEIGYLRNYIGLETLRLAERADIRLNIGEIAGNPRIAPMLLIVFIENCFKHLGSSPAQKGLVNIDIGTEGNVLTLQTKNSKFAGARGHSDASGIGLANVRKRLQLLYPGRHYLMIDDRDDQFAVTLKIKL